MATYWDKIEKYRARIKEAQKLGIEPPEQDISKLMYYVGRAQKKGLDHEIKFKDDIVIWKKKIERLDLEQLMKAAKVLLL